MKTCPKVCSDIQLNLKNRDWAFKNVGYGPANPEEPEDFWDKRAKEWATTPDNAQTMRCGNCSAFIQTPEMLDCILKGIDEETDGFAKDVQGAANLGYCELFDFKCAGARTCSAWLSGGPITKKMSKNQQNMLMMAKTEYDMEAEED